MPNIIPYQTGFLRQFDSSDEPAVMLFDGAQKFSKSGKYDFSPKFQLASRGAGLSWFPLWSSWHDENKQIPISFPHLDLDVKIDPSSRYLQGRARFRIPADQWPVNPPVLWLCQAFKINSLSINGKNQPVTPLEARAYPLPYQSMAKPYLFGEIVDEQDPITIDLAYSGQVAWEMEGQGGMTDSEIELALYSTWFPQLRGLEKFSHDLTLHLPSEFKGISNGTLQEEAIVDKETTYRWKDREGDSVEDINLLASNRFRTFKLQGRSGFSIQIHGVTINETWAQEMLQDADTILQLYEKCFGPLAGKYPEVTLVFMPRQGQSYSRLPLLVMSEKWIGQDRAKTLQVMAHEMAHFWWNKADPDSTNDWINEGLAEFSSIMAVRHQFGLESVKPFYRDALRDVAGHDFDKPMADTLRTEKGGGYFYPMGLLVFSLLHQQMGNKSFFRMLRVLKNEGDKHQVTTDDLRHVVQKFGGDSAMKTFDQWVLSVLNASDIRLNWNKSQQDLDPDQKLPLMDEEIMFSVFGNWSVRQTFFLTPNTFSIETKEKIQSRYDELAEKYENDPRLLFCKGQLQLLNGENEVALSSFDQALTSLGEADIIIDLFGPISLKGILMTRKGAALDLLGRREEALAVYQSLPDSDLDEWKTPRGIAKKYLRVPFKWN